MVDPHALSDASRAISTACTAPSDNGLSDLAADVTQAKSILREAEAKLAAAITDDKQLKLIAYITGWAELYIVIKTETYLLQGPDGRPPFNEWCNNRSSDDTMLSRLNIAYDACMPLNRGAGEIDEGVDRLFSAVAITNETLLQTVLLNEYTVTVYVGHTDLPSVYIMCERQS